MKRSSRRRSWSTSDLSPNISELLGVSTNSTVAGDTEKTFSGEQQGTAHIDLIQQAEYTSATLHDLSSDFHGDTILNAPASRGLPGICRSPASPTHFRSVSNCGSELQASGADSSEPHSWDSKGALLCQTPPKLKFGDPIFAPETSPNLSSHLSNTMIMEYFAKVSSVNPYCGLKEDPSSVAADSDLSDVSSVSGPPGNHQHRPEPLRYAPDYKEGAPVVNADGEGPHGQRRSRRLFMSTTTPADTYRLEKLSTTMEVEQLRTMLHELDRRQHLCPSSSSAHLRSSVSGTSTPRRHVICGSMGSNKTSVSNQALNLPLSAIVGVSTRSLRTDVPPPTPALLCPPGGARTMTPTVATPEIPQPQPQTPQPSMRRISRREHNIIAPVSF